ncbi:MAG: dehydrogenase, partial [Planctomycetaceae bacterium]
MNSTLRLLTLFLLATTGLSLLAAEETKPDAGKATVPESGVLPKGADGHSLNLDFETGDLSDWTAEGAAFENQPVRGDAVFKRRRDMKSEHTGTFWIGTYEVGEDAAQGMLTSVPFTVTHPWAAFLVGGGNLDTTGVELVRKNDGAVVFKAAGSNQENMTRVVADLRQLQGEEVFLRIVDRSDAGWGHVNFDDFRFYREKPYVAPQRPADLLEFAGLSPDEAARAMTVPEGFRVTAFAGEPDVVQPIAMTIDARGRLWVAEAYAYPVRVKDEEARDRILIFEDTNGDGKFDVRKVFADKLNLVSGIEVGFGGVWVGAAPEFLFIPDRNGDDVPDGPAEVLLDGWGYQDTHETLNSFIWGPDGWLYGCHGVFTHSKVGKPGTADDDRTPLNAGIWRYHPTRHEFEVFAFGTSNPWGVDFNDNGHCFLTCCVIPHLFHMVQGARYQRQGGVHFQKHTYADIQTIANHRHWVGNQWNEADRAKSDANGGGHAHAGAMIYLGGAWPEQYRDQLFMNNIHGARLNLDLLSPRGSGYEGNGAPDFCRTNDVWSQILYLRYGPDGQVYLIDWYDRNQCHHGNTEGHDRSNGRIFKISYGDSRHTPVDLAAATDAELVQYQLHANDWYVRTGRRVLQERAAAGSLAKGTRDALAAIAFQHAEVSRRLRGLWALHVTGGLTQAQIDRALHDDSEHVRSWAIQLACESRQPEAWLLDALMSLSRGDDSPVVRLYIASALQRIAPEHRWAILTGLLAQGGDASDHNLPLMYWYAAEPLAEIDPAKALALAAEGNLPIVHEFMVRRIGSLGTPEALELLVGELKRAPDTETRRLYLAGLLASLKGRRRVDMPASWNAVRASLESSPVPELKTMAFGLSVKFGDPAAFGTMREAIANRETPEEERKSFLESLLAAKDPNLVPLLQKLLDEAEMRAAAIRGLAAYDESSTPDLLLKKYAELAPAEKRDVLATLTARPEYALALLSAIGSKHLPATDLTADFVSQLRNLKHTELNEQIERVWGVVRDTPEDKAKLISHLKELIAGNPINDEDLPRGRAVFAKVCQQCHTLFGAGGRVGPELTGSNRANLDYLLSNVVDPSAVLAREYTPRVIETTGGRVVTGLVKEETPQAITVLTAN